jgi:hypothetical protein
MEFDLEIDCKDNSPYANGKFHFYLLNEKDHSITPMMYGNGLSK